MPKYGLRRGVAATALYNRFSVLALDDLSIDIFMDLLALPRPLVLAIFALLPVDTRLRCIEVNRAWRALLADTSLWACLDFCNVARFSEALFRAAVAKAGGQLRALDITGRLETYLSGMFAPSIRFHELNAAVVSNAASLTELRVYTLWNGVDMADMRAVLASAPSLQHFELGIYCCSVHEAKLMLQNEAPFGALRLRYIHILDETGWIGGQAGVASFCADLLRHASLEVLGLACAPVYTAEAMGAVGDACISIRLRHIRLIHCHLTPEVVPVLTRLVAAGALRELYITESWLDEYPNFFTDDSETQLFCAAVRASSINRIDIFGCHNCAAIRALQGYINARPQ